MLRTPGSRWLCVGTAIVLAIACGPGGLRAATIDATWSAGDLHWGVAVLRDGPADVLRLSVLPEPGAGLLLVVGLVALTRIGSKDRK